jgi:branched-subunit amino acid transport protein AzlD
VPEPGYLAAAVAVCAVVTWALRALPFAVLAPLRASPLVAHLGATMPVGVMVLLVVHSLRHVPLAAAPYGAPAVLALLVTAGLHVWWRNVVLSTVAGTAVHVVLVNAVFG